MPELQAHRHIAADPDAVWPVLKSSEAFSAHRDLGIEVLPSAGGGGRKTRWSVRMNGSPVVWTQRELAAPGPRLWFEQVDGDFEVFSGRWSLDGARAGTRVALDLKFDLGVDGLAPLLEPMWTQSLHVHVRTLLSALAEAIGRE